VDESAFRSTWCAVNPITCAFEKAQGAKRCFCEKSVRTAIAEREAVGCSSAELAADCRELLALLHENARFTLHLPHLEGALPHAKEMKVQCGGLLGLQGALDEEKAEAATVDNIFALLRQAVAHYGGLDRLPYGEIIKTVAAFEIRRRPSRL
jgi:hypothetical protein